MVYISISHFKNTTLLSVPTSNITKITMKTNPHAKICTAGYGGHTNHRIVKKDSIFKLK